MRTEKLKKGFLNDKMIHPESIGKAKAETTAPKSKNYVKILRGPF
jgi:hypothetical protein